MNDTPQQFQGKYLALEELKEELRRVYRPDGGSEEGPVKIAVTISGGGAAGAFEAGVLEVLKENGITPHLVCGASAGALNATGLFFEHMKVENRQSEMQVFPERSFIARLWRYIGRNNDGAKYILDRPRLITTISKNVMGQKKLNPLALLSIMLDLIWSLPVLLVMVGFALFIWGALLTVWQMNPFQLFPPMPLQVATTTGPALLIASASIIVGTFLLFQQILAAKSVFNNTRLYNTLYNATDSGDMNSTQAVPPETIETKAKAIVQGWYTSEAREKPEFIVTTTNLTNKCGMLFALVGKETYKRLVKDDWYTVQLLDQQGDSSEFFREIVGDTDLSLYEKSFALFTDGSQLVRSVLSSTSIPVVFPSQTLQIYDTKGASYSKTNHYTDGGVLNNSPIHVAIAAGATHVISIELDDLRFLPFQEFADEKDKNRSYTMIDTLTRTFFTLLTSATSEDVSRSASWNKVLVSSKKELDHRRMVQIYRIAPTPSNEVKPIGVIDFNGRYENGKLVTTLADWMNYGKTIAGKAAFWRATVDVYPSELPK